MPHNYGRNYDMDTCNARECPTRAQCARASDTTYTRLLVTDLAGRCVNFRPMVSK